MKHAAGAMEKIQRTVAVGKAFLPNHRRFGGMRVQLGKRELDRFPVMRLEKKLLVKIIPRDLSLL